MYKTRVLNKCVMRGISEDREFKDHESLLLFQQNGF